jgi:hypothetical protein
MSGVMGTGILAPGKSCKRREAEVATEMQAAKHELKQSWFAAAERDAVDQERGFFCQRAHLLDFDERIGLTFDPLNRLYLFALLPRRTSARAAPRRATS